MIGEPLGSGAAVVTARMLSAFLAAVLLALSIAQADFAAGGVFSLALLVLAIYRADTAVAAIGSAVFGAALIALSPLWYPMPPGEPITPAGVAGITLLALLMGLGISFLTRFPLWVPTGTIYITAVISTFAHSSWFGNAGLAWAVSQAWSPMRSLVPLGGVTLLTLGIVLLAMLLAYLIVSAHMVREAPLRFLATAVASLACITGILLIPGNYASPLSPNESGRLQVVAVQNNDTPPRYVEPMLDLAPDPFKYAAQWTLDYAQQARSGLRTPANLYVWPAETVSAEYLATREGQSMMGELMETVGAPILIGTSGAQEGNVFLLWRPHHTEPDTILQAFGSDENLPHSFAYLNANITLRWSDVPPWNPPSPPSDIERGTFTISTSAQTSKLSIPSTKWFRALSALNSAYTGAPSLFIQATGGSLFLDASGRPIIEGPSRSAGIVTSQVLPSHGVTFAERLGHMVLATLYVLLLGVVMSLGIIQASRRAEAKDLDVNIRQR